MDKNQQTPILKETVPVSKNGQQLTYPLDKNSLNVIKRAIFDDFPEMLMDYLWRNVFYYQTLFEGSEGFIQVLGGSDSFVVSGNWAQLSTGADTGNIYFMKEKSDKYDIGWDKKCYFRCSFQISSTSSVSHYITLGQSLNATGDKYAGFKVVNGSLYGVISNNGTNNELLTPVLQTLATGVAYNVQMKFYPNNKALFYFNPTPNPTNTTSYPNAMATLSGTQLPQANSGRSDFYFISLNSTTAVAKAIKISSFEYVQNMKYYQ